MVGEGINIFLLYILSSQLRRLFRIFGINRINSADMSKYFFWKALWLFFILTCIVNKLMAQDGFISEDLARPEIVTYEFNGGQVIRELSHPRISYDGTEQFKLFNPEGRVIPHAVSCIGLQCFGNVQENDSIPLVVPLSGNSTYEFPIGISLTKEEVMVGNYVLSVRKMDGTILHERKFRVVNPQPRISSISSKDANGVTRRDTLLISRNKSFDGCSISFLGSNLDQEFKSVTIQGLPLERSSGSSLSYNFTKDWNSAKAMNLELGESSIIIKRQVASLPTTKRIFIAAPKPEILGKSLEFQVEEGQSKIDITLQVENLFDGAKVYLDASSRVLLGDGWRTADVNVQDGTISFTVIFEPIGTKGSASFNVKVKNADGKESEYKTITLIKKSTTIRMIPIEPQRPFMAGTKNQVRFVRLKGGAQFDFSADNKVTILFDNSNPITIDAEQETINSFTASVPFPDNIPAGSVRFNVKNDKTSWNGELNGVLKRPLAKAEKNVLYRGASTKIQVENATDVFLQTKETTDHVTISQPENNSTRVFEIKTDKYAEDFTLVVKLFDHVVQELPFVVVNYPEPAPIQLKELVQEEFIKQNKIILDEGEDLNLSIPIEGSITKDSKFYAQVYKKDGTLVGEKEELTRNAEGTSFTTTFNTQIGLQPGEEFVVKLSNPNQDSKVFQGYITRKKVDRWIFTAGLSAIDYRFGKKEEGAEKVAVLDGVNTGLYYLPENFKNPSTRFIGYGGNIILSSYDGDFSVRIAASVLLLEKVVVGLSFGDQVGLLMGVNIPLGNMSALLGN